MPLNIPGSAGLDWEATRFSTAVQAYLVQTRMATAEGVKKLALYYEGNVKQRTPVDTGRLRASIHTVFYGAPDNYSYSAAALSRAERRRVSGQARARGEAPPKTQQATFDGALSVAPSSPLEAIVGTNVKYALFVELGTRYMAPRMMFRAAMAEMTQRMNAVLRGQG